EIKTISSIREDFIKFREIVNQYHAKRTILGELIYAFSIQYSPTFSELEDQFNSKKREISDTTIELQDSLNPRKEELSQTVGAKGEQLESNKREQKRVQDQLAEINSFESI